MTDNGNFEEFWIRRWGAAARNAATTGRGEVVAVFERAFYGCIADRLICIGGSGFPAGPLNAETDAPAEARWAGRGVVVGAPIRVTGARLAVGDVRFRAEAVETWQPPAVGVWSWEAAARGEAETARLAVERAPADSMAALLRWSDAKKGLLEQTPETLEEALRAESRRVARAFGHWLAGVLATPSSPPPPEPWLCLIGLGPGLTPSGDDLLGGALVALSAIGADAAHQSLAAVVMRHAPSRTSAISAAHLQLAAEGVGGAALHALLAALLKGHAKDIEAAVDALADVGHTSGWDMLAGVLVTLWAVRAAEGRGTAAQAAM